MYNSIFYPELGNSIFGFSHRHCDTYDVIFKISCHKVIYFLRNHFKDWLLLIRYTPAKIKIQHNSFVMVISPLYSLSTIRYAMAATSNMATAGWT